LIFENLTSDYGEKSITLQRRSHRYFFDFIFRGYEDGLEDAGSI
jgi:hypothetical protein